MTTPEPASQPQAAVPATLPVPARPRARRKRLSAVNGIARQFGGPSGSIGHLVTGLLARGNASFNRWVVHELGTVVPAPATVIELGCGPGIALMELLTAYPAAFVVGVDPSPVVLGRPGAGTPARTRGLGGPRPRRPRLPAPPAHAADRAAHLPAGRFHPLRL
jgi:SAM-dependent methyltransferase